MRRIFALTAVAGLTFGATVPVEAVAPSLRGSPAAMVQQNRVAQDHGLDFYRTTGQIREAVARGELVELTGNENYAVADFVRLPYAQPEVRLFIERLSAQYRQACGQRLVVTSAVRPGNGQPSNAHALSVHPAGMAVDLRVSDRASCRSWLESTLLNLERSGVINGIREFHPPHYHVAVFPEQYLAYAQERMAVEAQRAAEEQARQPAAGAAAGIVAAAPGSTALVGGGAAERDPEAPSRRGAVMATLLLVVAMPIGIGVLAQRALKR
jgi:hypothetical protein